MKNVKSKRNEAERYRFTSETPRINIQIAPTTRIKKFYQTL